MLSDLLTATLQVPHMHTSQLVLCILCELKPLKPLVFPHPKHQSGLVADCETATA